MLFSGTFIQKIERANPILKLIRFENLKENREEKGINEGYTMDY